MVGSFHDNRGNRQMDPSKRFFEDMAKAAGGAASALSGFKAEIETMVRHKTERLLGELNVVRRDEFDAVKAMAAKARTEQEKLSKRIDALEAQLGIKAGPDPKPAKKPRPASRTKAGTKAPSRKRKAAGQAKKTTAKS